MNNSRFFWDPPLDFIWIDFEATLCQKGRFLRGAWHPLGHQMDRSWNRPASEITFGALQGTIWDELLMKCHGCLHHFGLIFDAFLATILQTTKATCHDEIGLAIHGQLPTTPPNAPFSQYFWRALLSKAKFWENAKNHHHNTVNRDKRTNLSGAAVLPLWGQSITMISYKKLTRLEFLD